MENKENIIRVLNEFREDDSKIIELETIDPMGWDIIDIIFEEQMYDILLKLFEPFTLTQNGEMITKIFFDPFSLDVVSRLEQSYSSKEKALEEATKTYEKNLRAKDTVVDDEYLLSFLSRSVEEILEEMTVIPQKDQILEKIFNLDLEKIDQIKIKNSHARFISGINNPIYTEKDVILYAEPACLRACLDLFRKNIQTIANDTEGVIRDGVRAGNGVCRIDIAFDSLDDENKSIVQALIIEGKAIRESMCGIDTLSLMVSCDREETIGSVSRKMLELTSRFVYQDILYGMIPKEKIDEEVLGFYIYDADEGLYWRDASYLKKHKDYLLYKQNNSNKGRKS